MLVGRRGVWFEFAEKMFVFLGEIQKTLFFSKDDSHPTFCSFTKREWLVITAS